MQGFTMGSTPGQDRPNRPFVFSSYIPCRKSWFYQRVDVAANARMIAALFRKWDGFVVMEANVVCHVPLKETTSVFGVGQL